ncbi:hypothetical protein LEP1GSC016_0407 [Leptospira borgpetersenii serovar Hardjo-bovis str. Sponselee]|uniref:Lipoprotein n=1 Tax=Leptospira borgpetersenii serovar Hardjo-bovis str. Sponselee TaxID=1303729 RepID=M6CCB1_LEPBO|nr:hypothetical protein LBK6_17605 [Leptospira borgpetersenii serovar Hardjo]AMX63286.1 hypothetical protein LBK9_17545 [Leptospira borgpetersenii serovar Hardjo]AMX66530.1 hypothetical protein LBK30_17535 [Leptospira borgpetersenii serovar Hardjo]AMX69757.1 hypothetical protein LBHA_17490 [Leptospira borgpetersenii serovar Hardjo]EMJ83900.1 hypothetical protein LEP1GSC016_0407 [Leptospira borgpetersenii serovar Hardjo-bovis str. Sponselee]
MRKNWIGNSALLMILFGSFVYSCQKIDLDSRKIFIASGNKNLPFFTEIEGRNYLFGIGIRFPLVRRVDNGFGLRKRKFYLKIGLF